MEREFHGIQEVIIQNFRAKPGTAMARVPDCGPEGVPGRGGHCPSGPRSSVHLQAPPTSSDPGSPGRAAGRGNRRLGRVGPVTADHVNPERPWPSIQALREVTQDAGLRLAARLTIHPPTIVRGGRLARPQVATFAAALADEKGLLAVDVRPVGRPWQESVDYDGLPPAEQGRTDLAITIDIRGRDTQHRSDFDTASVRGTRSRDRIDPGSFRRR